MASSNESENDKGKIQQTRREEILEQLEYWTAQLQAEGGSNSNDSASQQSGPLPDAWQTPSAAPQAGQQTNQPTSHEATGVSEAANPPATITQASQVVQQSAMTTQATNTGGSREPVFPTGVNPPPRLNHQEREEWRSTYRKREQTRTRTLTHDRSVSSEISRLGGPLKVLQRRSNDRVQKKSQAPPASKGVKTGVQQWRDEKAAKKAANKAKKLQDEKDGKGNTGKKAKKAGGKKHKGKKSAGNKDSEDDEGFLEPADSGPPPPLGRDTDDEDESGMGGGKGGAGVDQAVAVLLLIQRRRQGDRTEGVHARCYPTNYHSALVC